MLKNLPQISNVALWQVNPTCQVSFTKALLGKFVPRMLSDVRHQTSTRKRVTPKYVFGDGWCPISIFGWKQLDPNMGHPSGKHTKNDGKSPFLMGKSSRNDNFQ